MPCRVTQQVAQRTTLASRKRRNPDQDLVVISKGKVRKAHRFRESQNKSSQRGSGAKRLS